MSQVTNVAVVEVSKAAILIYKWSQFGTKLLDLVGTVGELIEQSNKSRGSGVTIRVRQASVISSTGALTFQQQ